MCVQRLFQEEREKADQFAAHRNGVRRTHPWTVRQTRRSRTGELIRGKVDQISILQMTYIYLRIERNFAFRLDMQFFMKILKMAY